MLSLTHGFREPTPRTTRLLSPKGGRGGRERRRLTNKTGIPREKKQKTAGCVRYIIAVQARDSDFKEHNTKGSAVAACLLTRGIPEPWFGISKQQQQAVTAWDESIDSIRETTAVQGGDFFFLSVHGWGAQTRTHYPIECPPHKFSIINTEFNRIRPPYAITRPRNEAVFFCCCPPLFSHDILLAS
jgi:hypothetical protein